MSDDNLARISNELLVETILNFGILDDVRELIQVLGLQQTAATFYKTTVNRPRHNYFPEVANFFKLYFNRHALVPDAALVQHPVNRDFCHWMVG